MKNLEKSLTERKVRYQRLSKISPLLAAIFIDVMAYSLVYPIIAALFTEYSTVFGVTISEEMKNFLLGMGYALNPIFMFFGAPFLGDLSDIWGRKKTLLFCMAGLAFAFCIMGIGLLWPSMGLFLFGRALTGFMAGSQPVAQAAIIDLTTIKERSLHMALLTIALNVSFVIGPMIGGVFSSKQVASIFGLNTPLFIAAGLTVCVFLWILAKFKETGEGKKHVKVHFLRPIEILVQATKNHRLMFLSFLFLLMQVGIALFFIFSLILLREGFGYSTLKLGLFNGLIGLLNLLSLFLILPGALKRFSEGKLMVLSLMIQAVSQLGYLAFENTEWILWALLFLLAPANIIAFTLMMTFYSHLATKTDRGFSMGVFGSVIAIGFGITSFATNLLEYISSGWLIFFGGVLVALSAVLMIRYLKRYESNLLV